MPESSGLAALLPPIKVKPAVVNPQDLKVVKEEKPDRLAGESARHLQLSNIKGRVRELALLFYAHF